MSSESTLATAVQTWLHDLGYETWPEVQAYQGSHRADLVYRRGPVYGVVEVKTALSLRLLGQGVRWLGQVHEVYVAAPRSGGDRGAGTDAAVTFCKATGLGLIRASERWDECRVEARAKLIRRRPPTWADKLSEQHRAFATPGTPSGYWTPFQETRRLVQYYVKEHPGVTIRDLIESIDHHYGSPASARGSLIRWIEEGKFDGVRIEREGRAVRLYPDKVPA